MWEHNNETQGEERRGGEKRINEEREDKEYKEREGENGTYVCGMLSNSAQVQKPKRL